MAGRDPVYMPNEYADDYASYGQPTQSNRTLSYSDFSNPLDYLRYMADQGDEASIDKLINYWMSEASSDRARQWTAEREDTQYQRLFRDISALGINPYIMLQSAGAGPVSSASSSHTYSGSQATSKANNEESNGRAILTALLSLIPILIVAAL